MKIFADTNVLVSAFTARGLCADLLEIILADHHVEPIPDNPSKVEVRDEDDRWVLESALRAKADILVTGDKDLLDIAENVPQLKIISPRGFWELLQR